jgi:single-stranded DNA-binding protein
MNLKIGMSAITGKVQGLYNKETRKGEVKRGTSKNGNKYQIFEISVSTKNQDGTYTNGKPIKVMITGSQKIDIGDSVGLVGRFQAENYTDKDGKEVRGLVFTSKCEDMFTPLAWDSKPEVKAKEEDINPWSD